MRPHQLLLILCFTCITSIATAKSYAPESLTENLAPAQTITSGLLAGWQGVRALEFSGYGMYWGNPVSLNAKSSEQLVQIVASEFGISSEFALKADNKTPTRNYLILPRTSQSTARHRRQVGSCAKHAKPTRAR
ncbi:MAG: hypothetical protein IPP40_05800 [bacterium]|nr:hypothetical protein [bacterium]